MNEEDLTADTMAHNQGRRAADRRVSQRRLRRRREMDRLRTGTWEEQRTQFMTRYLFIALGLTYFNGGESVVRNAEHLVAVNLVHLLYAVLTTIYMVHARRNADSPLRLRLAMWTDVIGVSAAVFFDSNIMSPAYLVYPVISLGNGMRYGIRAFAEAAFASLAVSSLVFGLRISDYLQTLSLGSFFFILFVVIIVLYSYALMKNVDRARDDLEIASFNDALTGLLNRRGLHERAHSMFNSLGIQHESLAVLFADLDGFKLVNDAHGHDAGDRLLQQVARVIAGRLRGDDIVARFGGDEFVVILPGATLEQAAQVAKRLQGAMTRAVNGESDVSLTIGIGLAPDHGADLDTVLKSVDAAMYQGKLVGGKGEIRRADGVAVA